jgi:hypothetical protein
MSLAHSRLVVMVVYLCFLTRLLPVKELLLPLELPVAVALAVVLLEALVQVAELLVDSTDSLGLQDCSCLLDSSDSLRNCLV